MTEREELALLRREVRALRNELVRHRTTRPIGRYSWLKHFVNDLETNPHTQYKVHLYGVVYWLINFPLVCYLFFGLPTLWLKLGIFITLMYSIYANFATDYGAMSASMAAFEHPLPEVPLEVAPPGASSQYGVQIDQPRSDEQSPQPP